MFSLLDNCLQLGLLLRPGGRVHEARLLPAKCKNVIKLFVLFSNPPSDSIIQQSLPTLFLLPLFLMVLLMLSTHPITFHTLLFRIYLV